MVTEAIVTCVMTSVSTTTCQALKSMMPYANQTKIEFNVFKEKPLNRGPLGPKPHYSTLLAKYKQRIRLFREHGATDVSTHRKAYIGPQNELFLALPGPLRPLKVQRSP